MFLKKFWMHPNIKNQDSCHQTTCWFKSRTEKSHRENQNKKPNTLPKIKLKINLKIKQTGTKQIHLSWKEPDCRAIALCNTLLGKNMHELLQIPYNLKLNNADSKLFF